MELFFPIEFLVSVLFKVITPPDIPSDWMMFAKYTSVVLLSLGNRLSGITVLDIVGRLPQCNSYLLY